MGKHVVLRDVPAKVRARLEFKANDSLTGGRRIVEGILPWEYRYAFGCAQGAPDYYAVHSYLTPIAWYAGGEWTVPDVKYSRTTTRHQSVVRQGIAL